MIVVFDTNVVVEAIFWPRSNARRALSGLAKRSFQAAVNSQILEEYSKVTSEIQNQLFPHTDPAGPLAWITAKSLHVQPAPLPENLSRDPDDNILMQPRLQPARNS